MSEQGRSPFPSGPGPGRIPWWLAVVGVLFLAGIGYLVASSLSRPSPPTFDLHEPDSAPVGDRLVRDRRVTLDARDADRWVRFDFSRGSAVPDSATEWDLAARRFRLIVNGGDGFPGEGGVRELDDASFDSIQSVPADGYVTTRGGEGPDPEHPVLDEWYRYDLFSHLLMARGTPYAIRTADGRYAVIQVLSYYCPGPEPGCLTFRYHYQGNGSRRVRP